MACNECKKKKDQSQQNGETNLEVEGDGLDDTIDLIPKSLVGPHLEQNFVLKFVVFLSIGVMLPLIIIALLYQLFMTFFFPTSLTRINNKITQRVKNIFNKYAYWKGKKEYERRKKVWLNNRGYEEGSELVDIEVYDEEGYNEDLNDNNNK